MKLKSTLKDYILAAFSGLWVQTDEPEEAHREIVELCNAQEWSLATWDMARGFWGRGGGAKDPEAPLVIPERTGAEGETSVVVLWNYHCFLKNPLVVQRLQNCLIEGKGARVFFVVLSPVVQIPRELEKLFVVLEHELPNLEELAKKAVELETNGEGNEIREPAAISAACGLTRGEAEGAFALSLVRHPSIHCEDVWDLKRSMLKKSGLLELHRGNEKLDDIKGATAWKDFCLKALKSPSRIARPRGTLLLGPSGTGKSALCKALSNASKIPMLRLLTDRMKSSGYGDTEQRMGQVLRIVDAMAPCIFFVDEIEKLLAGASRKGDPGATLAVVGILLEWLQDHTTEVFTVMTSNDVSELPPEFSRAERFDGVFFLDLPEKEERVQIWRLYKQRYDLADACFPMGENPKQIQDEGWTGAEIHSCCRLAALLDIGVYDATRNIVPVSITNSEKIAALREWASGRCIDASYGGVYQSAPRAVTNTNTRRVARSKA